MKGTNLAKADSYRGILREGAEFLSYHLATLDWNKAGFVFVRKNQSARNSLEHIFTTLFLARRVAP